MPISAPAPFGLLGPLSIIAGHGNRDLDKLPAHIMVPVDSERAVLVSIDERGKYMVSDPYARIPGIIGGQVMATTTYGKGPLVFVDLADGRYCGTYPFSAARVRSIEQVVKAVCADLSRSCPSFLLHEHEEDAPLQQPGASSSKGLLHTATLDATSSISPQAEALTLPGTPIFARVQPDWGMEFYIRPGHGGSFHTYPDVGGPFQTIEQADKAIDKYLHGRRHPKMCMEQAGVSLREMGIRRCLFWPDGTMKKRTKSYIFQKGHEHMCRLVRAVVDQYNEYHKLGEDRKYELKDVTEQQSFHEDEEWYRHLNITASSEGFDKQFFVELKNTRQEGLRHAEWVVSCFSMVDFNDNGYCKGCPNDVKHPNKADAYSGGHVGPEEILEDPDPWSDSDEDETSRERRIRRKYDVPRKPFVYPACATPKPGHVM
ncbi:uncharacterized protein LOC124666803 [Lolium rigidum]|uniref:uncharacterized protein LOC124666803 n=1 Tax=Lolium rigidum TaxID=89674 RepID=UPI001F5CE555|nr:uncharacterized protein LOC124666803 [Lolium rigidum]